MKKQQGLTLLEMLIAMMLSSVILVLLFSGIDTIQNSWLQSQRINNEINDLKIVDRFIRGRLEQALFLSENENTTGDIIFKGQANSISYLAPMMTYVGYPGIYEQTLSLQDNKLIFEWKPYRKSSQNNANDESRRILLEDVSDLRINYYGVTNTESSESPSASWNDHWELKNGIPNLIKIHYKYQEDDIPEIIVPLAW